MTKVKLSVSYNDEMKQTNEFKFDYDFDALEFHLTHFIKEVTGKENLWVKIVLPDENGSIDFCEKPVKRIKRRKK